MRKALRNSNNRRDMLISLTRYAAGVALAAAGGFAVMKRRALVRNGGCAKRGLCMGCDVFQNCSLPPAVTMRQATARTDNG